MNRCGRIVAGCLLTVLSMTVIEAPAWAAAPPPTPAAPGIAPPGASSDPLPPADMQSSTDGTSAARLGCTPDTGVDNPHRSSTGVAVSAHGWWNKGSCTAETATVKICLYEYYTDGSWRRKACAENSSLKPGGGSARRVPVRRDCTSTERTSWRAHVDVDVNGQIDTGEVQYRQADVNCRYTGPDA